MPQHPLTTQGLVVDLTDGVLRITIDRPERLNALDGATSLALTEVLHAAATDTDVRVVVLTGRGESFSTGADLVELGSARPTDARAATEAAEQTMTAAETLVRAIIDLPVPVVARVVGPAAGIGASLALASDLIYASDTAYFLLAFTAVGLMPDGASSLLVPAAIGRTRANAMALLAEPLGAQAALDAGLVNEVLSADALDARVDSVARRIARGPRRALELTKRAMTATTLALLDETLAREREGQIELLTSPAFDEGFSAMLEHRRPTF